MCLQYLLTGLYLIGTCTLISACKWPIEDHSVGGDVGTDKNNPAKSYKEVVDTNSEGRS